MVDKAGKIGKCLKMNESLSKCEVIDLYSLTTLSIASDIKILFEGKNL